MSTGNITRRLLGHSQRINAVCMNEDATVLFTGSYDSTVCLWDLRASGRDPIQVLSDSKDSVTTVALTKNEILVGSVDGKLRVYDIRAGRLASDDHSHPITCTRVVNNQKCALTCCLDETLYLTEIGSGKLLKTYRGY